MGIDSRSPMEALSKSGGGPCGDGGCEECLRISDPRFFFQGFTPAVSERPGSFLNSSAARPKRSCPAAVLVQQTREMPEAAAAFDRLRACICVSSCLGLSDQGSTKESTLGV